MRHEILRLLLFAAAVSAVVRVAAPAPGRRGPRPRPTLDSGGPAGGRPAAERTAAGGSRPGAACDRSADLTGAPVTTAAGTSGHRRRRDATEDAGAEPTGTDTVGMTGVQ